MRLNRTIVVAVLLAVLLAAAAPAVQAVSLAKPQRSSQPVLGSDWLSAALTWFSGFFVDRTQQAPASREKSDPTTSSTTPTSGNTYRTFGGNGSFAGSCIDPNGCLDGSGG